MLSEPDSGISQSKRTPTMHTSEEKQVSSPFTHDLGIFYEKFFLGIINYGYLPREVVQTLVSLTDYVTEDLTYDLFYRFLEINCCQQTQASSGGSIERVVHCQSFCLMAIRNSSLGFYQLLLPRNQDYIF